jgi:hypothetical protein
MYPTADEVAVKTAANQTKPAKADSIIQSAKADFVLVAVTSVARRSFHNLYKQMASGGE